MEKLYFDSESYFNDVFKAIDHAQFSVTLEYYIFNYDQTGQELIQHLIAASKRDVKVQLTIDSIGSINFPNDIVQLLIEHHIEIKFYNRILKPGLFKLLTSFLNPIKIITFLKKLNKRTHRKYIFIDNHILFSGSINITDVHKKWVDFGIQLKLEKFPENKIPYKQLKDQIIRLNDSFRKRNFYYKEILYLIKKSQKEIILITPYFNPKFEFIRRLVKASANGVQVKVLTSHRSDVPFFTFLQKFYYPYLLAKGIKIFEYHKKILHAKGLIIDHWMIIGSSNYNFRSINHDLEIDIRLREEQNKIELRDKINHYISESFEIDLKFCEDRSIISKILTRLISLFKYWL